MAAPQAKAEGTLTKTPFAHLLVYIETHRLTGTLVVGTEQGNAPGQQQGRSALLFRQGQPIAARFEVPVEGFEQGVLPLFLRGPARYAFYEADLVGRGPHALRGPWDPMRILALSLAHHTRDAVVDRVLGRLGQTPLRLKPGAPLHRFQFGSAERGFIDLLRAEPADLSSLVQVSGLPESRARRVVYLLAITRCVENFGARGDARGGRSTISTQMQAVGKSSGTPPQRRTARRTEMTRTASLQSRSLPIPSMPPDLSQEHAARWSEIVERYQGIDSENYFEMLGVDTHTNAGGVRAAYFGLAKTWHPDRLPEPLEALRAHVELVFGLLSEAHACLSNDPQRARYQASIELGGGTPAEARQVSAIMEAAVQYQKVEVLARRRAYAEALELLDDILKLNGDEADYHAMRAYLLLQMAPDSEAVPADAQQGVVRALELNSEHERAHFTKGLILKRKGKKREALAAFRATLEINPRHLEAGREVRLAGIRRARAKTETGGFITKLFGKKSG